MVYLLGFDFEDGGTTATLGGTMASTARNSLLFSMWTGPGLSTTGLGIDPNTYRWPTTQQGSLKVSTSATVVFSAQLFTTGASTLAFSFRYDGFGCLAPPGTMPWFVTQEYSDGANPRWDRFRLCIDAQLRISIIYSDIANTTPAVIYTNWTTIATHPRVLTPQTWYRIEFTTTTHAGTPPYITVTLDINGQKLSINRNRVDNTRNYGVWYLGAENNVGPNSGAMWFDDIVSNDGTGDITEGRGWGDVKVESLAPVGDANVQWTRAGATTNWGAVSDKGMPFTGGDVASTWVGTVTTNAWDLFTMANMPTTMIVPTPGGNSGNPQALTITYVRAVQSEIVAGAYTNLADHYPVATIRDLCWTNAGPGLGSTNKTIGGASYITPSLLPVYNRYFICSETHPTPPFPAWALAGNYSIPGTAFGYQLMS